MNVRENFLKTYGISHQIAPDLISVVESVINASIEINHKIRLGNLAGIIGEAGTDNVQGEHQKKLDVLANQIIITHLHQNPEVAGLASEEEEQAIVVNTTGKYLVLFDPLDGSSNIDIDVSVGTIFSILIKKHTEVLTEQDFLQTGENQLAAGYILYGPQTILALTFGDEVLMFTLDDQDQFTFNPEKPKISSETKEFAINMSNQRHWSAVIQHYILELQQGTTGTRNKDYNMRWVASMVAEIHRILKRGGIFLYPDDARKGLEHGKLRLMYEANPMSLLIKAAGGKSSNGLTDILEIQPQKLHQRVPVILGSQEEVEYLTKKIKNTSFT